MIDVLRGDQAATSRFARLFEDGDEPFVNATILCEVATGARAERAAIDALVRAVARNVRDFSLTPVAVESY